MSEKIKAIMNDTYEITCQKIYTNNYNGMDSAARTKFEAVLNQRDEIQDKLRELLKGDELELFNEYCEMEPTEWSYISDYSLHSGIEEGFKAGLSTGILII